MPNTTNFLKEYLRVIGFEGSDYDLKESQDDSFGYLISLKMSAAHPRVGILIGKDGRHLRSLKELLRVIGIAEGLKPYLIVKIE